MDFSYRNFFLFFSIFFNFFGSLNPSNSIRNIDAIKKTSLNLIEQNILDSRTILSTGIGTEDIGINNLKDLKLVPELDFQKFSLFEKEKIKNVVISSPTTFTKVKILGPKYLESEYLDGKKLFLFHCSVCHLGGTNLIIPEKNLRLETLEANGINNLSAISYQIINGKNGMPAFGGRLSEKEINTIARYVLDQKKHFFQ